MNRNCSERVAENQFARSIEIYSGQEGMGCEPLFAITLLKRYAGGAVAFVKARRWPWFPMEGGRGLIPSEFGRGRAILWSPLDRSWVAIHLRGLAATRSRAVPR